MPVDTAHSLSSGRTLGDLVNQVPGAARVFESFGLDYCCGGQRSLDEACALQDVDVAAVDAALAAVRVQDPPDWAALAPAELVDHLESTHHVHLRAELPRLDALAEKVASVHGRRHPELLDVLADVKDLRSDLEPHLTEEERVLFPLVRRLAAADAPVELRRGSVRHQISVMLAEHDDTGALLEQLRDHADDYAVPDDACASYRALYEGLVELEADTHLHVHKENNLLFPAVVALATRLGSA